MGRPQHIFCTGAVFPHFSHLKKAISSQLPAIT